MHSFLPSLLSLFLYLIPPRSSLAALAAIVSNAPLPSSLLCVSLQERVSQPKDPLFSVSPYKSVYEPRSSSANRAYTARSLGLPLSPTARCTH